jgi:hypothetical protein
MESGACRIVSGHAAGQWCLRLLLPNRTAIEQACYAVCAKYSKHSTAAASTEREADMCAGWRNSAPDAALASATAGQCCAAVCHAWATPPFNPSQSNRKPPDHRPAAYRIPQNLGVDQPPVGLAADDHGAIDPIALGAAVLGHVDVAFDTDGT